MAIDPDVADLLAALSGRVERLEAFHQLPPPPPPPPPGAASVPPWAEWWNHAGGLYDEALSPGPVLVVDPSGDDTASGSSDFPLRTIPEALARVNAAGHGKGHMIRIRDGVYSENDADGGGHNVAKHEPSGRLGWNERRWLTIVADDPERPPTVIVSNHEGGIQARGDMVQIAGVKVRCAENKPTTGYDWFGGGIVASGRFRADRTEGSAFFRFVGNDVEGVMGGGINTGFTTHHLIALNRSVGNAFWAPKAHSGFSFWKPRFKSGIAWSPFAGAYTDIWWGNYSAKNDNKVLYDWGYGLTRSDGNGFIADLLNHLGIYDGRVLFACNVSARNGGRGIHSFKSSNVDAVANTAIENSRRILEDPLPGETAPFGPGYEIGVADWDVETVMRTARNTAVLLDGMTVEDARGISRIVSSEPGFQAKASDYDEFGKPNGGINSSWGARLTSGGFTHTLQQAAEVLA